MARGDRRISQPWTQFNHCNRVSIAQMRRATTKLLPIFSRHSIVVCRIFYILKRIIIYTDYIKYFTVWDLVLGSAYECIGKRV